MASQSLNHSDEAVPVDHAVVEQLDQSHGRFPHHQGPISIIEYRQVNVDQLSESDFDGVKDSGLDYSDHDYIGSNPNVKCSPDVCQFPVMGGVTDQYLSGETTYPCLERPADSRLAVTGTPHTGSGSVMRKPPQYGVTTMFRPAKGEDYDHTTSPQYSTSKSVTWKTIPNVTQPKKSGRPPKNETRDLAGDRLMGRAMIKAGIQTPHGHLQPHMHHLQGLDGMEDLGMNVRGAAPIVTPARGPKIMPRGRPAAVMRREIPDDGSGGYAMMPLSLHSAPPYRSIPASSPKKGGQFRSAQAAEEAHTREMMEAAQNALAPSNAISGHNVMLTSHNQHHSSIVLPVQHQMHQQPPSHHLDEADLPRTPGKGHLFTPHTSPLSGGARRTISESQEMNMQLFHEPLRLKLDGLPVTPGGGRKTPGRSRTPRSRKSISESTTSGSPQRQYLVSPPCHQTSHQPRPLPSSPQRQMAAGYIKSQPAAPILPLAQGPSTMASAQLQMSSNAPMPSLHNQTYHQQPAVQRHMGQSPGRSYYDSSGVHGAPLITASGSNTYTPRRRKEKEPDEAVEAEVSRNVKNIMQAEKTSRLSATSSHTLSPRNETSDDDTTRGRQLGQPKQEVKRTSPSKRAAQKQSKRFEMQSSGDESEEDEEEEVDDWLVSCICGQTDDDGEEMVQCDKCKLRWEHVDCIFPRTKKAPEGEYTCHSCRPRPTELTPQQARAYQDRVKEQKERHAELELKRKLAERAKRKEESCRKPALVARTTQSKGGGGAASKNEKSVTAHYREIVKNEYSANARRFLTISRSSGGQSADAEIINILRNRPRVRPLIVEPRIYGLVAAKEISGGDYIAELCGQVSLLKECPNRDLAPGSLNDHTFIFEKDGDKIMIDARRCGNSARFIRRSCKPNAEFDDIMSGSELHIMIKAKHGAEINANEEVSIGLESDWKKRARPIQGCACKKDDKKPCEVQLFFCERNKMHISSVSSSSRRSLPTNGTTFKGSRSPVRRAETEKKKGGPAKKIIVKKGKKKSTIKLSRHSRKGKGVEGSTAGESEGEIEEEKTVEYEESTADEKDREDKTRKRGRRNTKSRSEGKDKEKEVKKNEDERETEMTVLPSTRSSVRIRNDSDDVKKEMEDVKKEIYEENDEKNVDKRQNDGGGLTKGERNSTVEIEKEVKEEMKDEDKPSSAKKEKKKKSWPLMDYSLPRERNKPSREERKLQADLARMAKSEKEKKSSRGTWSRGKPSTLTPTSRPNEEKEGSSGRGRGKRKTEAMAEDERVQAETVTAAASTLLVAPPKKRLSTIETAKRGMEREREKEISPAPSSLSSMASPQRDDFPSASPAPLGGKKQWLHRHQEAQKAKAEAEAAKVVPTWSSASSTPTRSKRSNKKEERGAVEALVHMGGMREKGGKGGGVREEMRRHAIKLKQSLTTTEFTMGENTVDKMEEDYPSSSAGPSAIVSSVPSVSIPWIPSTPSAISTPCLPTATESAKTGKTRVSLDEYRKRKQSGVSLSGGEKKEASERKEEPPKKSFMPSVHASTSAPVSLPNVKLPGIEEEVDINELSRRVYGDTRRRDVTSSSTVTEPPPKRQSINDRLKNEFALPTLCTGTADSMGSLSSSSSSCQLPHPSSLPVTAALTLSVSSFSTASQVTPTSGRIHKNRLSDQRAENMMPPGLIECPRPSSIVSPSTASSREYPSQPSHPSSTPSHSSH